MKAIKRFFACLCAVACMLPLLVWASDVPALTVSSSSVTAGSNCTVSINTAHFAEVMGVSLELFYDSQSFAVVSVDDLSGKMSDINTAVPGKISVSMLSINGFTASSTLLQIRLQAKSTATPGAYPLRLAIGEAYVGANDGSLRPVSLSRTDGVITVQKPSAPGNRVNLYASQDKSVLKQGEEATVTWYSHSLNGMAAGNFELQYDHTLLEFAGLSLGAGMTAGGNGLYVHSVNDKTPGRVLLSYAAENRCANGTLFAARFRCKADVEQETSIAMSASGLISEDRRELTADDTRISVTLQKTPAVHQRPRLLLTMPDVLYTNEPQTVTVVAEGVSQLAAGDFTIAYDTEVLEVVAEPKAAEGLESISAAIGVNPSYQNGIVKFTFICSDGIQSDTALLTFSIRSRENAVRTTELTCTGKGMVDAQYQAVDLELVPLTIVTQIPTFTVVFRNGEAVLSSRRVSYLSAAEAPDVILEKEPDAAAHYRFLQWDRTFSEVREDMTVNAVFEAIAHTPGAVMYENTVPATCSTAGSQDAVTYCTSCGQESSREQRTLPTLDHSWERGGILVEPTEAQPGLQQELCTVCDATREVPLAVKKVTAAGDFGETGSWTLYNYGRLDVCGTGPLSGESVPWELYAEEIRIIDLGYGITGWEQGAFAAYRSMETLGIPDSVTELPADTLESYTALKTIRYGGVQEQWEALQVSVPTGCTLQLRTEPLVVRITTDKRAFVSAIGKLASYTGAAQVICAFYDCEGRFLLADMGTGTGIVTVEAEIPQDAAICRGYFLGSDYVPLCAAISVSMEEQRIP